MTKNPYHTLIWKAIYAPSTADIKPISIKIFSSSVLKVTDKKEPLRTISYPWTGLLLWILWKLPWVLHYCLGDILMHLVSHFCPVPLAFGLGTDYLNLWPRFSSKQLHNLITEWETKDWEHIKKASPSEHDSMNSWAGMCVVAHLLLTLATSRAPLISRRKGIDREWLRAQRCVCATMTPSVSPEVMPLLWFS